MRGKSLIHILFLPFSCTCSCSFCKQLHSGLWLACCRMQFWRLHSILGAFGRPCKCYRSASLSCRAYNEYLIDKALSCKAISLYMGYRIQGTNVSGSFVFDDSLFMNHGGQFVWPGTEKDKYLVPQCPPEKQQQQEVAVSSCWQQALAALSSPVLWTWEPLCHLAPQPAHNCSAC